MCVNCCWKSLLYLATYEDFRDSIKSLKSCFKPQNNLHNNEHERESRKSLPQIFLSESHQIINTLEKPLQRGRLTSISIPVTNTTVSGAYAMRRMSMMPSVNYETPKSNCKHHRIDRQPSTRSQRIHEISHLSPSQSNLTRSRSMTIQSNFKHSPNCKWRKKFEA